MSYIDHVSGDLGHLKVGDPVHVRTHYNDYPGEVVKKGTKNLTVQWGGGRTDVVRISTGRYADGGSGIDVYSVEQWEMNENTRRVKQSLREVGVTLDTNHKLTPELMRKVLDLILKEMS